MDVLEVESVCADVWFWMCDGGVRVQESDIWTRRMEVRDLEEMWTSD
jgi:hypothetical protein